MEDYLAFRRMITPVLVQILFWIGTVVCLIVGLGLASRITILGSLVVIAGGVLIVRIYCELLILFFRMNETLTDIRASVQTQALGAPPFTAPSAGSRPGMSLGTAATMGFRMAPPPGPDERVRPDGEPGSGLPGFRG